MSQVSIHWDAEKKMIVNKSLEGVEDPELREKILKLETLWGSSKKAVTKEEYEKSRRMDAYDDLDNIFEKVFGSGK